MFQLGRNYFHVIGFLEYLHNLQPNNADFRWDSSLRAASPESVLFAKSSILPLALKELTLSYVQVKTAVDENILAKTLRTSKKESVFNAKALKFFGKGKTSWAIPSFATLFSKAVCKQQGQKKAFTRWKGLLYQNRSSQSMYYWCKFMLSPAAIVQQVTT